MLVQERGFEPPIQSWLRFLRPIRIPIPTLLHVHFSLGVSPQEHFYYTTIVCIFSRYKMNKILYSNLSILLDSFQSCNFTSFALLRICYHILNILSIDTITKDMLKFLCILCNLFAFLYLHMIQSVCNNK